MCEGDDEPEAVWAAWCFLGLVLCVLAAALAALLG